MEVLYIGKTGAQIIDVTGVTVEVQRDFRGCILKSLNLQIKIKSSRNQYVGQHAFSFRFKC